ncbi:lysosomal alpha-glucosidase-like [Styela clava]
MKIVKLLALFTLMRSVQFCIAAHCDVNLEKRIDCFPESSPLHQEKCEQRGCCYNPRHSQHANDDVPWCFFPSDYTNSYLLTDFRETNTGFEGTLKLSYSAASYPPNALPVLKLFIYLESPNRLHFKIIDPVNKRYEVPIATPKSVKSVLPLLYDVNVSLKNEKFFLKVVRSDTGLTIFDTSVGPILYGDQYLQISTSLASSNIYGLGERHGKLRPDVYWHRIPFWAADHAPGFPQGGNLYGDHPFYIVMEPDGKSHGVFFLNSNAKEAELQSEPALTWRSIGGIMDFYIFLGPSPEEVIQQYTDTVGRPFMPPMWSLGYHLCRWGYLTANTTLDYVEKMREAKIPQDVQWNDIDYMDRQLDFTYNSTTFSTLPSLVKNLHSHRQHYVMIVDPGISSDQPKGSYSPFDDAVASHVLVKDSVTQEPVNGVVWPGNVVFPDFTNPATTEYWHKQLSLFHQSVEFDGVWIDMNEYSNFQDGCPKQCYKNNTYDYPPYVPKVTGGSLFTRTICPSSLQYVSNNYNVHSLTGLFEMKATSEALIKIRNKRPFVISRSTFPSAGLYGGHWTGDIKSTWEHMRLTIPGILGFNMFGIPLVGADICGFGGKTTIELCTRWSQLGAFYPFSRNHNDINGSPQAPVDFPKSTQSIIRKALSQRYTFLPYLYTLFHIAHTYGGTVARPLFFEFPTDTNTYAIEEQFLWGHSLMISPVLYPSMDSVKGYFAKGLWYDAYMEMGKPISSEGEMFMLNAPIDSIPLHIRGGSILPLCDPDIVTSMAGPLFLIAAADEHGKANGSIFWDDGDTLGTYPNGEFVFFKFDMRNNTLSGKLAKGSKSLPMKMEMSRILIYGLQCQPTEVTFNGQSVKFVMGSYNDLTVNLSHATFQDSFILEWTCA